MQFVYFIPGRGSAGAAALEAFGIAEVLGCAAESGPVASGPGGAAGTILWASQGPKPDVEDVAALRWVPQFREDADGEDAKRRAVYYVGVDPEKPPRPDELLKGDAVEGERIELADGNMWIVPRARMYDEAGFSMALPGRLCVDDDGRDEWRVVERYRRCWDAALAGWNQYVGMAARATADKGGEPAPADMTVGEAIGLAADVLGCNYRVGLAELKAIGALSSTNAVEVLRAAADIAAFEEMIESSKKNGPEPPAADS